ncbi:hypothetical protein [Paratractidigestivibacter sp.]|uniref:hypothetical protein n=1 Tax=Paratractidigestivibacter sp. TaxID=2847316 RepID=UPI002ABD1672|nr:hypothetical protein [Paratractidigestivibacter sp.]
MGVSAAVLRPRVPMGFIDGTVYVAALGAAESLGAHVAWPNAVVDAEGAELVRVTCRAGYDDEGIYVTCEFDGSSACDAVADAAAARVDAWSEAVAAGSKAGPLAAVLEDYFDACLLMGRVVKVVRRDGSVACEGALAGMDIWGRVTVKLDDGREVEIAPGQASVAAA